MSENCPRGLPLSVPAECCVRCVTNPKMIQQEKIRWNSDKSIDPLFLVYSKVESRLEMISILC